MPTQQKSSNAAATAAAKASVKGPAGAAAAAAAASGSILVASTGSTSSVIAATTGKRKPREETVGINGGGDTTAAAAAAFSNGNCTVDLGNGNLTNSAAAVSSLHTNMVTGFSNFSSIAAAKNSVKTQPESMGKSIDRSTSTISNDSAMATVSAKQKKKIVVKKSEGSSELPQPQQHTGEPGAHNGKSNLGEIPKKLAKHASIKSTHSVTTIVAKSTPGLNTMTPESKPKPKIPDNIKPKLNTSDNIKSKLNTPDNIKFKVNTPDNIKPKSSMSDSIKVKPSASETKYASRLASEKPLVKTKTPTFVINEQKAKLNSVLKAESPKPKSITEQKTTTTKSIERSVSSAKPSGSRSVSTANELKSMTPDLRPKKTESKSVLPESKINSTSTSSKSEPALPMKPNSKLTSISPRPSLGRSHTGVSSSSQISLELPPKLPVASESAKKKLVKRQQSPIRSDPTKVLSPIPKRTALNDIPLLVHHHQRSASDMPVKLAGVGTSVRNNSNSPKRSNTASSTHSTTSLTLPKAPSQRPLSAGSLRHAQNQHNPTPPTVASDRPLSTGTRKLTHKKASLSVTTPPPPQQQPNQAPHNVLIFARTSLRDKKKPFELINKSAEPAPRTSFDVTTPRPATVNSGTSTASANNVPLTAALLAREKSDTYRQQIPSQQHRGFFDRVKKKFKITDSQNTNSPSYTDESADEAVMQIKTTMRKQRKKSFNEDKPWKHHADAVKLTENERKRYEGLWATNRGIHVPFLWPEDEDDADSDSDSDEDSDYDDSDHDEVGEPVQEKPAEIASYIAGQQPNQQIQPTTAHEDDRTQSIHGIVVRSLWQRSRLSDDTLRQIWDLVDRRGDGCLDREGFLVGMWLVDQCLYGRKLPLKIDDTIWNSVGRLNVRVKIRKTKKERKAEKRTLRKREKEERRLMKKTKK